MRWRDFSEDKKLKTDPSSIDGFKNFSVNRKLNDMERSYWLIMSGDTLIYISTFGQIKLVLKFEAKSKFNDAVFVQVVLFNHLNESDLIYLLSTDKRIL